MGRFLDFVPPRTTSRSTQIGRCGGNLFHGIYDETLKRRTEVDKIEDTRSQGSHSSSLEVDNGLTTEARGKRRSKKDLS